jgi:cyclophilin family peptidyl-prolyl cis-trans isomerase/HEAT repeat protein
MQLQRTIYASFVLCAMSVVASAQAASAKYSAPIPKATLIQIMQAEDERRWDDSLKSLLSSNDAAIRKRAALAAGRIGVEAAVPVLTEMLLTDREAEVREMAAFALGEIESAGGAYALVTVVKDPNKPARARSVEALGKIAAALAGATTTQTGADKQEDDRLDTLKAAILETLRFEDNRRSNPDRLTILLGLTAVLRARPEGVGPLVAKFLEYPDSSIVATALNTMARLRLKEANERVRQLLKDGDPIVRANAARVIGAAEHKEAFDDLLAKALNDPDLRVRVSAIRSLGSLKDTRAAQPLLDRGVLLLSGSFERYSASTSESIGVPECDSFMARYQDCISTRVSQSDRAKYKQSMDAWRSSWKKLAENPGSRTALAAACKQAAAQQDIALRSYGCAANKSEILEIVTVTGSLLRNSKSAPALQWLREVRDAFQGKAPEVEIALARVDPQLYLTEQVKLPTGSPAIAQGISELATIKKSQPEVDRESQTIISWMGGQLDCKFSEASKQCLPPLSISPMLRAYATFKPDDLEMKLRARLNDTDVVVRSTAAELLGEQPPSDANTRLLIEALPRALRDTDLDDAAIAIIGALAKQKNAAANEAIKTALNSQNQLIRRRAVALLKANGAGDFSDRIGTVQTRNKLMDYRRAIARFGKRVTATLVTSKGSFTIEFLPEEAPLTIDNFIQLARRGYFNGQTIPRVVPNFVIQAGDPRGDQNGGPGYSIRCEINEVVFERASVGMALSGKDTGGSQWFVTHSPQPHLDGGYTVFGRVIRGMEVVDGIARGDTIRRVIVNEK